MRNFLMNLEKMLETKIYIKYGEYEYGIRNGNVEIDEKGNEVAVMPAKDIKVIKALIDDYANLNSELETMKTEILRKYDQMFTMIETARLSSVNANKEGIADVFLRLIKQVTGFSAAAVKYENGKIIKVSHDIVNMEGTDFPEKDDYSIHAGKTKQVFSFSEKGRFSVFYYFDSSTILKENEEILKVFCEEFRNIINAIEYRERIEETYFNIIAKIAEIISRRNYSFGDKYSMDDYVAVARLIGKKMGLTNDEISRLKIVAALKDIGTALVPEAIIHKNGNLSKEEYNMMKKHTENSGAILSVIPYFENAITEIKSHHEKWDGSGYPAGLSGNEIPVISRIIHVADVFFALISPRMYRPKTYTATEAMEIIGKNSGKHFDPQVCEYMKSSIKEIAKLLEIGE